MGRIVIVVSALLCAGCAQSNWTKAGMTADDLARDKLACDYEATKALAGRSSNLNSTGDAVVSGINYRTDKAKLQDMCMATKGYTPG